MIRNRDRSVGARVAGEIGAGRLKPAVQSRAGGIRPLPFFEVRFVGSAGQSFGAFTTDGMLADPGRRSQRLSWQRHERR